MLSIPHCPDDQLRDGRKVVSHTHRPRPAPNKHYLLLLVLISLRGWVKSRAYCCRKDYVNWKSSFTSSGFKPATFRLVACVNRGWTYVRQNLPDMGKKGKEINFFLLDQSNLRLLEYICESFRKLLEIVSRGLHRNSFPWCPQHPDISFLWWQFSTYERHNSVNKNETVFTTLGGVLASLESPLLLLIRASVWVLLFCKYSGEFSRILFLSDVQFIRHDSESPLTISCRRFTDTCYVCLNSEKLKCPCFLNHPEYILTPKLKSLKPVVFNFFVRVTADIISLQRCSPKLVGA
jgi:hypothetical protein